MMYNRHKVMIMEPISDVLSGIVAELIDVETGAGRDDRAADYGAIALNCSVSGFEFESPVLAFS